MEEKNTRKPIEVIFTYEDILKLVEDAQRKRSLEAIEIVEKEIKRNSPPLTSGQDLLLKVLEKIVSALRKDMK